MLALQNGILDAVPVEAVAQFRDRLPDWLAEHSDAVAKTIDGTGTLDEPGRVVLLRALEKLAALLVPKTETAGP